MQYAILIPCALYILTRTKLIKHQEIQKNNSDPTYHLVAFEANIVNA